MIGIEYLYSMYSTTTYCHVFFSASSGQEIKGDGGIVPYSVLELNASPQMDPKQINNDIDGVKRCVLISSLFPDFFVS